MNTFYVNKMTIVVLVGDVSIIMLATLNTVTQSKIFGGIIMLAVASS